MAKVIVNLSDTMDGFVNKTNLISTYVGDLTTLSTTEDSDLVGAINEIFALVDSDAYFRNKISVTDAGGDGSLSYNSTSGVITYTGPSAAEVRAHFSAGGDLAYNSSTGEFSFTDSAQRSDAYIRGLTSVTDAGGDGSLSYNSTTGVITYTGPSATEVRAHFSAGTAITLSSGEISVTAGSIDTTQLTDDAVSRAKLKDEVGLVIYNSAGTALKTLYGAGS